MAINVWTFTGNIGRDAEQRFTPAGDSIVSFPVATQAGFGEKAITTWARCSIFGKRGDSVLPYLNKGQQVAVSGELAAREWENKDGIKQTSIEVRVNDLQLIGKRDDGQQQAPQQRQQAPAKPSGGADEMSDIPF
ncbi:single-stranded DNA-binding protein [Advenella mimigardefordensis]|uniref:Single-stranded DNA-binding protein n=1 Tax=Advenella mimigardefordensis (strain DSM 17166 / LMG 22922 / DPN7) TaxID=1247726 RepID=W0PCJ2_ADVMD|nr:single-stranded DNA-binding protein [Advenella mimigardefordensis]AHG63150.1 putative single-stranded DNA-binding protein [Advenella mimigardefordensis DPN7]